MLRGVDVRKYYKTPVEVFTLHSYFREEAQDNLRFRIMMEATLLNRQDQAEVTRFNNLLREYSDLMDSSKTHSRTDFTKKAEELLKRIGDIKYKAKKPSVDITKKIQSPLTLESTLTKKREK